MRSGHLCGFEREAGIGPLGGGRPKKVDFRLDIQGEKHLCELKAPCISQTKTKRNLRFYFRDNAGGIFRDFKKLDDLPGRNKWVLGFVYPAPEFSEWSDAIASVPDSLRHWQLTTRPQDYPKYLFLALWRDTRIAQ